MLGHDSRATTAGSASCTSTCSTSSLDYLEAAWAARQGASRCRRARATPACYERSKGPLAAEKVRDFIADEYKPADYDLVLVSGVGSVWPMLRAHSLLNCLHTVMGKTPLVMFYPGRFDGTTLQAVRADRYDYIRSRHQALLPRVHAGPQWEGSMKIQDLFERDIFRPINGVVKADQLDDSSVWQELDEFVVTRELTKHITDLVAVLLVHRSSPGPVLLDKNGIWISGFFGSGKSHFIKVLSYLLENADHAHNGEHRRPSTSSPTSSRTPCSSRISRRSLRATTDVILFNIDSKADHRTGRDAILQVFLKVLNEMQGYSGDHPHIAHMERYLDENGKLAVFHAAFERESGEPWLRQRDAYEFHRDEVVAALDRGTRPERRLGREVDRQRRRQLQPDGRELRQVGQAVPRPKGPEASASCSWSTRSASSSATTPT